MEDYRVVKRDGKLVEFDLKKIISAMEKAFGALEKHTHSSVIQLLGAAGDRRF